MRLLRFCVGFALLGVLFAAARAHGEPVWIDGNDPHFHLRVCNRISKSTLLRNKPQQVERKEAIEKGWTACPYCMEQVTYRLFKESLSSEDFLAKRALLRQAKFEADYEYWQSLTIEQRESIRHTTLSTSVSDSEKAEKRFNEALSTRDNTISMQSRNYDEQDAQAAAFNWTASQADNAFFSDLSQFFSRDEVISDILGRTEDLKKRAAPRAEKINIRNHLRKQEQVLKQQRRRAESHLGATARMGRNTKVRNQAEINRIIVLDQALDSAYSPSLVKSLLGSWSAAGKHVLKISAQVWRVDLEGTGLSVSISRTPSGGAFTSLRANGDAPIESYIFDEPGEYHLQIEIEDGTPSVVSVYKLSKSALEE